MNKQPKIYAFSWCGKTAIAGGILWILYYVFDIAYGILEDYAHYQVENSPALRITGPAYFGGVVLVGLSLCGVFMRLKSQYKYLSYPAIFIGGLATAAATLGFLGACLSLLSFNFPSEILNVVGPSVLAVFISSILLGIASLKAQSMPFSIAALMLVFGLTTLPLGLSLWGAFPELVPGYFLDELHFAIAGAYWVIIGQALHKLLLSEEKMLAVKA